jgi:hypothetical protein
MESNRVSFAAILKHPAPNAILSGHFRSLLAPFGLTPKSKRRLDSSEAVDKLDEI